MNGHAGCSKYLGGLAGAVLLLGTVCGISGHLGSEARIGCLLAMAVCTFSATCWGLRVLAGAARWRGLVEGALSRGPWIRLRTTLAGVVFVGSWVEQELVWFLGWTGFFYTTVLVLETMLLVRLLRGYKWKDQRSIRIER